LKSIAIEYGTDMATPSLPVKPAKSWKRVAIVSFFGGVGFAITLAIILGAFLWHETRPTAPKPWNTTAIGASYTNLFADLEKTQVIFEFRYSLENSTDMDYEIPADAKVMIRLAKDKSYRADPDLRLGGHVFIPSHQKVNISLKLPVQTANYNVTEKDTSDKTLFKKVIRPKLLEIDGFAVFDQSSRYPVGAWVRLSNRPKPPQPWNTRAVTATYEFVGTDREKSHIVFVYTIQNNTNEDYRLTEGPGVEMFHKLLSEKSIFRTIGAQSTIHFPVFVPASGRTTVVIDDHSEYSGQKPSAGDS
jgi:hypothetical protein